MSMAPTLPKLTEYAVGGYLKPTGGYVKSTYDMRTYSIDIPPLYVKHVFKSQNSEVTEAVVVDADITEMGDEGGTVKISYAALKMLLERCGFEEVA